MAFDSLSSLYDQAALYARLQQESLVELTDSLGEYRWDVDLSAGSFAFTSEADPTRRILAGAELIASIAPGPRSMLWGWSMPNGRSNGFAAQLREYGEQHGIADLVESEVPFPDEQIDDLGAWVLDAAHQVGTVATAISGHGPYFAISGGGGSRGVVMLTLFPPLPQPTLASAIAALPRLLSELRVSDQRRAVWGLAQLAGWTLAWSDEQFSGVTLTDGASTATIGFDAQARITGVEAQLSA